MIEQFLIAQTLGPLGPTNFLKHAIHLIASSGVPPEIPIFLLLLPLATTLIVASRYLIGIQGLGIFTPVMLAVVFLSTGITLGVALFLTILLIEVLATIIFRKLRVHFMAKIAAILWLVCLGLLFALTLVAKFDLQMVPPPASLVPILILILLGENLAEIQVRKTSKKAARAITETLALAILAFLVLNSQALKTMAIFYPELLVLLTLAFNLFLGQFTGLRLLEYKRFRKLLGE